MRLALLALVAFVALLAGCGSSGSDEAAAPAPTTITVTKTEIETVTATAEPETQCSTSGLRLTLPEQDLPEPVAATRKAVFGAAVACDYDELERLALEQGEGFTFSYGGGDSAAEYWRALEESGKDTPLKTLATILTLPHSRNETGSYAWPSAYDETPTDEDWQALIDAGVLEQAQVDQMQAAGSYLGYRTAITPDGDWQFYVAGD